MSATSARMMANRHAAIGAGAAILRALAGAGAEGIALDKVQRLCAAASPSAIGATLRPAHPIAALGAPSWDLAADRAPGARRWRANAHTAGALEALERYLDRAGPQAAQPPSAVARDSTGAVLVLGAVRHGGIIARVALAEAPATKLGALLAGIEAGLTEPGRTADDGGAIDAVHIARIENAPGGRAPAAARNGALWSRLGESVSGAQARAHTVTGVCVAAHQALERRIALDDDAEALVLRAGAQLRCGDRSGWRAGPGAAPVIAIETITGHPANRTGAAIACAVPHALGRWWEWNIDIAGAGAPLILRTLRGTTPAPETLETFAASSVESHEAHAGTSHEEAGAQALAAVAMAQTCAGAGADGIAAHAVLEHAGRIFAASAEAADEAPAGCGPERLRAIALRCALGQARQILERL